MDAGGCSGRIFTIIGASADFFMADVNRRQLFIVSMDGMLRTAQHRLSHVTRMMLVVRHCARKQKIS